MRYLILAFCLASVYLIAEASAKPSPQLDTASDFLDKVKVRIQEAMDQAREAAASAMETAKTALQNGLHSVQEVAQSRREPGQQSAKSETEVVDQGAA